MAQTTSNGNLTVGDRARIEKRVVSGYHVYRTSEREIFPYPEGMVIWIGPGHNDFETVAIITDDGYICEHGTVLGSVRYLA